MIYRSTAGLLIGPTLVDNVRLYSSQRNGELKNSFGSLGRISLTW